jgi:hypothetical protein
MNKYYMTKFRVNCLYTAVAICPETGRRLVVAAADNYRLAYNKGLNFILMNGMAHNIIKMLVGC